ncbi:hypothetical protein IAR55_000907 [Kwoniella newhampshirensis]|uniref:Myb-like domain-containing protein n=1 Tax=Kwoniella newhampshirensis TaxID=1651941 RepID=A0AAW0Z498_9TREE
MKRSSSHSESENDIKPYFPSSSPISSTHQDKAPDHSPKKARMAFKSKVKTEVNLNGEGENAIWTPEKREKFVDKIFSLGMKAANMDELCNEFGMTKLQIRNATQAGRKGNFRDKACKAVKGDVQ